MQNFHDVISVPCQPGVNLHHMHATVDARHVTSTVDHVDIASVYSLLSSGSPGHQVGGIEWHLVLRKVTQCCNLQIIMMFIFA